MTVQELRQWVRIQVAKADLELSEQEAALEADELCSCVLNLSRERLFIARDDSVSSAAVERCRLLIERRVRGEPLAYILGTKEFYSLEFVVTPEVLIPRPETELLVDRALEWFSKDRQRFAVLDVGIGSGAILCTLMSVLCERYGREYLKRGRFFGIDCSGEALRVSGENARRLGVSEDMQLVVSDLLSAFSSAAFESEALLIVSNPPYIADNERLPQSVEGYEPQMALRGGYGGLETIQRLLKQSYSYLVKCQGNEFLCEIGHKQAPEVECSALEIGFGDVSFFEDLHGFKRVVNLKR